MFTIITTDSNTANVQIKSRKRFSATEVIALEVLERALSDVILHRGSILSDNTFNLSCQDTFDDIIHNYLSFAIIKSVGNSKIENMEEKSQEFLDELLSEDFTNILNNLNCKKPNPSPLIANKQLTLAKQFASSYFDVLLNKIFTVQDNMVY